MHFSCCRAAPSTWKPTVSILSPTPSLPSCSATSQGLGVPQLSSPSEIRRIVRVPRAPSDGAGRSSAAFRRESPIGVSPRGRTPATASFTAARSSALTGRTSRVSAQPCGRSAPYTRSPVGCPSGRASTTAPTAVRALSIRVRPVPSSSPMEPEESSTMTRLPPPGPSCGASLGAHAAPGLLRAAPLPPARTALHPPEPPLSPYGGPFPQPAPRRCGPTLVRALTESPSAARTPQLLCSRNLVICLGELKGPAVTVTQQRTPDSTKPRPLGGRGL